MRAFYLLFSRLFFSRTVGILLTVGSLWTVGAVAAEGPPTDSRAEELAKLRREVEALSTDVGLRKEELRGKLRAIEGQAAEIEVQLRREELRLAQIEGEAAARRAAIAESSSRNVQLTPDVLAAITTLRATVASGLPYRQPERLAELDTLQNQLSTGLVTPEAAAARLWAFVEDELRLTRENGLDRQVLTLPGGEEVLAEVVHLGMVAVYYRTDGGRYGYAAPGPSGWTWKPAANRDEEKAIEALFARLAHGVRSGPFTLPNPYAGAPAAAAP